MTQIGAGPGKEVPLSGEPGAVGLPLLDVVVAGSGRSWSGRRYCESVVGNRMRYAGHTEREGAQWFELEVSLEDTYTGLQANVTYQVLLGGGALRSMVRMTNGGASPLTLESVTSFLCGDLAGPGGLARRRRAALGGKRLVGRRPLAVPEPPRRTTRSQPGRARCPLARSVRPDERRGLVFGYLPAHGRRCQSQERPYLDVADRAQWRLALAGRRAHGGRSRVDLPGAFGPTDVEHHWRLTLQPGESFETVPVALALSQEGFEGAVACLTNYRRAIRRPHQDHRNLPVIFNDYMNTLMGDPSTERLLPLVTAAARAGAEYFCIDSGWYAELGESWWDTVGAWAPSKSRFPNGIAEVLDHIRAEGMVPGLWIEPEVVGVRSPVARALPPEAFFMREGERVVEQGPLPSRLFSPEH